MAEERETKPERPPARRIHQVVFDPPVFLGGNVHEPLGDQVRQYIASEVVSLELDPVGVHVTLRPGMAGRRAFTVPYSRVAAIEWHMPEAAPEQRSRR